MQLNALAYNTDKAPLRSPVFEVVIHIFWFGSLRISLSTFYASSRLQHRDEWPVASVFITLLVMNNFFTFCPVLNIFLYLTIWLSYCLGDFCRRLYCTLQHSPPRCRLLSTTALNPMSTSVDISTKRVNWLGQYPQYSHHGQKEWLSSVRLWCQCCKWTIGQHAVCVHRSV